MGIKMFECRHYAIVKNSHQMKTIVMEGDILDEGSSFFCMVCKANFP